MLLTSIVKCLFLLNRHWLISFYGLVVAQTCGMFQVKKSLSRGKCRYISFIHRSAQTEKKTSGSGNKSDLNIKTWIVNPDIDTFESSLYRVLFFFQSITSETSSQNLKSFARTSKSALTLNKSLWRSSAPGPSEGSSTETWRGSRRSRRDPSCQRTRNSSHCRSKTRLQRKVTVPWVHSPQICYCRFIEGGDSDSHHVSY